MHRLDRDAHTLLLGSVRPTGPAMRAALAAYDARQKRMAQGERVCRLLYTLMLVALGAAVWHALG